MYGPIVAGLVLIALFVRHALRAERPLLDDTGTGIGREFDTPGPDGTVALVTYLEPEAPPANTGNSELDALLRRRAELQMRLEQLKALAPELDAFVKSVSEFLANYKAKNAGGT